MSEKEPEFITSAVDPHPAEYSSHDDDEKRVGNVITGELSDKDHQDIIGNLRQTLREHELDPNFPADILFRARELLDEDAQSISPEQAQKLLTEIDLQRELLLNDSPYAEVRAVVDATDDVSTPTNTFRVWVLGTFFAILGTGLDQFFSLRMPGIWIYSFVAQLLCYPMGVAMARYLPSYSINLFGRSWSLNAGPFNQKEHMLITIMSNVAYGGTNGTAYVTLIFQVLKLDIFYGEKYLANSAGFQILLVLSTQLIGYGCAGLTRRFLVYPSAMIWPKNLAQIALNKALHHDDGRAKVHGWKISRFRFFLYCFLGMFVYFCKFCSLFCFDLDKTKYLFPIAFTHIHDTDCNKPPGFPNYIFNALSYFNWITWIAPNNVTLAVITGSLCGLGLNPWPTFDWNVLSYMYDPIITPWFALVNVGVGMAFFGLFLGSIVYWTNTWNTAYFPINSPDVFDNTGGQYNVTRILNADYSLNLDAYLAYSPPYLSAM